MLLYASRPPIQRLSGLVEREVLRIVTPGTVIDEEVLDELKQFHSRLYSSKEGIGLAYSDISVGSFI